MGGMGEEEEEEEEEEKDVRTLSVTGRRRICTGLNHKGKSPVWLNGVGRWVGGQMKRGKRRKDCTIHTKPNPPTYLPAVFSTKMPKKRSNEPKIAR